MKVLWWLHVGNKNLLLPYLRLRCILANHLVLEEKYKQGLNAVKLFSNEDKKPILLDG